MSMTMTAVRPASISIWRGRASRTRGRAGAERRSRLSGADMETPGRYGGLLSQVPFSCDCLLLQEVCLAIRQQPCIWHSDCSAAGSKEKNVSDTLCIRDVLVLDPLRPGE